MNRTSRCLALVVAILSCGLPAMAQPKRTTDVTRILNNMLSKYSRLASYQDEGILVTTIDEPTGGKIEKMPFKTFFKRPNLFRFEWTDFGITKLGRTKLIWFNGKEAFTYWEPDSYEKEESLSLAVAGATGVSYGTVHTISDLTMQEEFGASILKRLKKASLLGEEVFEGVRCYRIKGTDMDEALELWVGKTDLLLRKLRRESKHDDEIWIKEETRRKIQVDQSIPELVFNYTPPIALTPRKEIDVDKLLNPGPPAWSEFRSDEGRFTVLMPDKPVTQAATVETLQGRFEQHVFTASHTTFVYIVTYTDLPKQTLAANGGDAFMDGIRDQFIKEVGGKLESESLLSLEGHTGREIKVHMFRGELRLRVFLVGDRLYTLSIIALDKTPESEETFNKFFSSFKLNPVTKPIATHRTSQDQSVFCVFVPRCGYTTHSKEDDSWQTLQGLRSFVRAAKQH
jgi:outer membrane lipoprotein-sorting protein